MNFLKRVTPKSSPVKTGITFIVEDNVMYAKTLESSIKSNFPEMKHVKVFPVGETCLMDLHRNPDLIIIDYFLDSKYEDAETGLEIIRQIRSQKPDTQIIVLSSQNEIDVVVEVVNKYNCSYIKKDDEAFDKVTALIKTMN